MLRASGDVVLTDRTPGGFDVTVYKSRSEMVLELLGRFDLVAIGGRVGKCIAAIDNDEAPRCITCSQELGYEQGPECDVCGENRYTREQDELDVDA